ncbi:MAG: prolipoprotein diacylglyceryl transferase [Candidatus Rokubacteria bacterium]|nr:prolipoprotein diacylglyceryl transferase [Candidatus Rokubacteria bacterium]
MTLSVRWYGVLIASAMALGLWLAAREARRRGQSPDDLLKAAELALIGGLVGARLYYVLFNLDYYRTQPAWRVIAVWEGGLAIHGGLIGGILAGGLYVLWRALPLLTYLDIAAPSLAIGQAIGRWGNFFNEEAFGVPTELPWKLYISPPHRPPGFAQYEYFHPTFLYESLWDLAVFAVLVWGLRPRFRGRPGTLFFSYVGLYSVGRFAIEALRLDSFWVGAFRVPQLASVVGVMIAVAGLAWISRRASALTAN